MNLREKLNTIEGFQEIIKLNTEYILEDKEEIVLLLKDEEQGIKRHQKKNLEIINSTYKNIFKEAFDLLVCRYSIGETLDDFPSRYRELVASFEKIYSPQSYYVQMLNMLSLGILLDIENETFDRLVKLINENNVSDFIYDFIIHSRNPKHIQNEKLEWKKPYTQLKNVIKLIPADKEQGLHNLKTYLNKNWYMSLFKTHNSEHNIHSGYWCLESGAIVKILGLDDSSFKEQKYYPYDLVHWKYKNNA